jgi:poly(A) polymerase
MLRGARLAAKLGISIERKTAAPIPALAPLIHNVPPARLFDEMEKILLSGHAAESVKSLRRHGLHHGVLPLLDVILEQPLGQRFVDLALANTDKRVGEGKSVTPAFLFASLLWHEVLATWNASKAKGERPMPALFEAMDRVLEQQAKRLAIPRRFEATIKETWALQPRFEQRAGIEMQHAFGTEPESILADGGVAGIAAAEIFRGGFFDAAADALTQCRADADVSARNAQRHWFASIFRPADYFS